MNVLITLNTPTELLPIGEAHKAEDLGNGSYRVQTRSGPRVVFRHRVSEVQELLLDVPQKVPEKEPAVVPKPVVVQSKKVRSKKKASK